MINNKYTLREICQNRKNLRLLWIFSISFFLIEKIEYFKTIYSQTL